MKIRRWLAGAAAAGAIGVVGEYALARYFLRRTLIRSRAKKERTMKLAGTDWDKYVSVIRSGKEWIQTLEHEDIYITSNDGLKLHGQWFEQEGSRRTVICFHGYTSCGLNDFSTIVKYYYDRAFSVLLIDARAHGESEGTYIGFGCLDRHDARCWINEVIDRKGEDCQIMLHGVSMGGATVLMASGLELPRQVKGIISDCAFTSPWEVFSAVLKYRYRLPLFPLMNLTDVLAKQEAGYSLRECDAREEVKKAVVPIAFIHGDADSFVPFSMVHELYEACASEKELLVVRQAGHLESCYLAPEEYERMIGNWTERYFQ